uniref:Otopetrin 2 n=1 Tax=Eptatretus burgeri TaxID=7764 RepID=A0A8C4QA22_EPTBU
ISGGPSGNMSESTTSLPCYDEMQNSIENSNYAMQEQRGKVENGLNSGPPAVPPSEVSPPSEPGGPRQPIKKNRVSMHLSALYAFNFVAFGSALKFAQIFDGKSTVSHKEVNLFLTIIMAISMVWMIVFSTCIARNHWYTTPKDHHAGALWLKGWFLCKLRISFKSLTCTSTLIQLVHRCLVHVHVCALECRFGLMHTVSTNILIWLHTIVDESLENIDSLTIVNGTDACTCDTDLCHIFHDGALYLHPFNIELSLFSSTMLFVMWRNIGETKEEDTEDHVKRGFEMNVVVMVAFSVQNGSSVTRPEALIMNYSFQMTVSIVMMLCTLAGLGMYHKDVPGMRRGKSIVRRIDVSLLVSVSGGPLLLGYFMAVAAAFAPNRRSPHFYIGNPYPSETEGQKPIRSPQASPSSILQHKCPDGQEGIEETASGSDSSTSEKETASTCVQTPAFQRRLEFAISEDYSQNTTCNGAYGAEVASTVVSMSSRPSSGYWSAVALKRCILKNISAFLLLSNMAMWILEAFGERSYTVSDFGQNFYGFTTWVLVINLTMPLGIFYRMHSVASLFEVFSTA